MVTKMGSPCSACSGSVSPRSSRQFGGSRSSAVLFGGAVWPPAPDKKGRTNPIKNAGQIFTLADSCLTPPPRYVTEPSVQRISGFIALDWRKSRASAHYWPHFSTVLARGKSPPALRQGQLRRVPTAAHGFDQHDARLQSIRQHGERRLFRAQTGGLRCDHAAVGSRTRVVLIEGELFSLLGGGHRGFLDDRLLFQYAQSDEFILDLLKTGQNGLAVTVDGPFIGGAGLRHLCAPQASVEQRFGERRADRPDPVRGADQVAHGAARVIVRAAQGEVRKVRRRRNADLRIRRGHLAFRFRDIRTPLEQGGRNARGHRGHAGPQGGGTQGEGRGLLTDQHGDRVLENPALDLCVDLLRLARQELRLRVHDVGPRCHAEAVAAFRDFQRQGLRLHRIVEEFLQLILCTQLEIINRQFRLCGEARRGERGCTRLGRRTLALRGAANFSPYVQVPIGRHAGTVGYMGPSTAADRQAGAGGGRGARGAALA